MPEYNVPPGRDPIRDLMKRTAALERQVARLQGRGGVVVSRGPHDDIPNPHEGQVVVGVDNVPYFWGEGSWHPLGKTYEVKLFDDSATVAVGSFQFELPDGMSGRLVYVRAYVTTVSGSGPVTVQVENVTEAVDMLSTPVTIDAGELSSRTAATPPVIDLANDDVADGDHVKIVVDTAGSGAKGLGVMLRFG